MKKLVAFIVYSSVSCLVAAISAFGEHVRRFVRHLYNSVAGQTIKKRYGNI
jgi:hypothetical protein